MERLRIVGRPPKKGRPKGQTQIASDYDRRSLAELARTYTREALEALVSVFRDKDIGAAHRITAACAILDRGYGKPSMTHELTGADRGPVMMRLDQAALQQLPDDALLALQSLLAGLSRGDASKLQGSIDSSAYEDTLH